MVNYLHFHWLDWAFGLLAAGYFAFVPGVFWTPAWTAAVLLVAASSLCLPLGFAVDHVYYRRMKREQER